MDFSSDSFDDGGDSSLMSVGPRKNYSSAQRVANRRKTSEKNFEEIPQRQVAIGNNPHEIDYQALSKYIYPVNYSIREYQFEMVRKALFSNIICAIPTGTGKTFIAACVMMNYYRWFPKSKIIFVAPTRPLVAQQIKAAVGMTNIKPEDVAILLDKSRKNRPEIWESKRVIFSTPQVIENDLTAGYCNPKDVSLLVIDEAHRAKGNYAYVNIIKFIARFTLAFRVLGLTATPGSDIVGVQEVVDVLLASSIEIRTEKSEDIKKHMKDKEVIKEVVGSNDDIDRIVSLLSDAIRPTLELANKHKVYEGTDCSSINAFRAMEKSQKVINNPRLPEGLKWHLYFILQLLNHVGQMLRRLKVYGLRTFYAYFENKVKEFKAKWDMKKTTNRIAAEFYLHANIKQILDEYQFRANDPKYFGHSKLEILYDELHTFLKGKRGSRVIIFTEMRESALEIVRAIDSKTDGLLKPHIFIGQAREKEKFDEEEYRHKNTRKGRGKQAKANREAQELEIEHTKKAKRQADVAARERSSTGSSESAQVQGMNQKQQKQLIKEFKEGIFNILVATSIGEEGLDIGEVDMIIFYDSTSSPIKNIQRMGRTGRQRDGRVLLLLTESEDKKFTRAMFGYEAVQKQIEGGNIIKFHESDRMIPEDYKPVCHKEYLEPNEDFVNEEETDSIIKLTQDHMKGKAKRRNECIETLLLRPRKKKAPAKRFFMPDGVETGFRNVTSMIRYKGDNESLREGRSITNTSLSSDKSLGGGDIMNILLSDEEESDDITKSVPAISTRNDEATIEKSLNSPPESSGKVHSSPEKVEVDLVNDFSDGGLEGGLNDSLNDNLIGNLEDNLNDNSIDNLNDNFEDTEVAKKGLENKSKSSVLLKKTEEESANMLSFSSDSFSSDVEDDHNTTIPIDDIDPDDGMVTSSPKKSEPLTQYIDDDVTIEKVVRKERSTDIVSMLKDSIESSSFISSYAKTAKKTLGTRRKVAPIQSHDTSKKYEELKFTINKPKKPASKDSRSKGANNSFVIDPKDSLFRLKFNDRSGFACQRQETELYEQFGEIEKAFVIQNPSDAIISSNCSTEGKIKHSSKTERWLHTQSILMKDNEKNEFKKLRVLLVAQRRQEIEWRKRKMNFDDDHPDNDYNVIVND